MSNSTENLTVEAFTSIENDDLINLKRLISNEKLPVNAMDKDGMSLLVQAAFKGNDNICSYLLKSGADVNHKCKNNDYTALMMAALSGNRSTVELLLNHGAKTDLKNSIGKEAAELAGFVGQQECSSVIRNFLSIGKLECYYTPQGSNEARIPFSIAQLLQKLSTSTVYTPVKMVQIIMSCEELTNNDTIMKQAASVMDDLCAKCIRSQSDFDEVLAFKAHYISHVITSCRTYMQKNETRDLTKYLKRLLKEDDGGVKLYSEDVIRKSVSSMPYANLPIVKEFVGTIYPLKIGQHPTASHCIHTIFNGLRAASDTQSDCGACGDKNTSLQCGACKQVRYCSPQCQKLHWPSHKKLCQTEK